MKKHDFGKPLCRLIMAVAIMMLSLQAMAYDFSYYHQGKTLYYNRTSGNTVEVTYYRSDNYYNNYYVSGDVVIPSTVMNYSVTSIGDSAFRGCRGLTSVTIGNSVTSIGKQAFQGCSGLTTLNFNAINCQDFEAYYDNHGNRYYPFSGTSLTTVNIGDSVQQIPKNFVRGCRDLTSVTIPNSVTSIGDRAFYDCSYLTSVTIGNSVTSIGVSAFYGCRGLTSITIPNSVTSIGGDAFRGCSGLTTLNFNAINCQDSEDNGWYYYPFSGSLTTVNIGDSVQRIPANFVRDCSRLTSVTIPNSVTSIGKMAFVGCSGLTTLNFNAINCQDFEAYYDNHGNRYYPFSGTSLTTVNIGDSVRRIPAYFVRDCSGLTSVTIPNSVTSIGNSAFYGCSGLTSINVASGNTHYSSIDGVLYNYVQDTLIQCPGAKTSVTIPNSVTSIGYSAFSGCSGLTSVTIPNSVTFIGKYAFCDCSGLITLNFNAINCQDFEDSYFNGNYCGSFGNSLTTVNIGDSVQRIPAHFVKFCRGLTSVTIPNGVTSIGEKAFEGCSGLTSVRCLASAPPSIGSSSFSGISSTCTLTVSCVSLDAYVGSDWNTYFGGRILEDSTEEFPFELTASANDLIEGSVDISIGERCDQRILTATPESCYRFNAWSDGNRSNPRIVTLTQDTAFTAYFDRAVYTQAISHAICEGSVYTENGFNVSEAGTYTQNLQTVNGCDSIVTLTLTVNPVESTTLSAAICEGTTYTENGFNVSEAGTYTQNLQTVNGCDSIVTLTLTVNPTYNITIDASINDGETYAENGFSESEAGTYVHTLQSEFGCDSVITLNLTVNSSLNDVVANAVEVRLYPNPAKSFVTLEFEALKENTLLQILDINGRKVRTFDLKAGIETLRIDLGDLPKGVYTIMVGNTTKKLIVE